MGKGRGRRRIVAVVCSSLRLSTTLTMATTMTWRLGAPLQRSRRGQRWRRLMHQQYFLMLERAPAYFWVGFFVRESKRFLW